MRIWVIRITMAETQPGHCCDDCGEHLAVVAQNPQPSPADITKIIGMLSLTGEAEEIQIDEADVWTDAKELSRG